MIRFNKENVKWFGVNLGDYRVDIADLENNGKLLVIRDPKIYKLSVKSKFWVASYDKAQGVPHLMEHCLFSNVMDGKSMFQCSSMLEKLGININAATSHKDMCLVAETTSCMKPNAYPNDALYEVMHVDFDYKTLLKRIADIHYNLITTNVSKEYMEQEKNVIYGEMQSRYPGDMQNIRKTAEWNTMTGGKYSSIGAPWNIKDITTDHINYMRNTTFNNNNIKTIVIEAPDYVELDDIVDIYMSRLYEGLYLNSDIINNANNYSAEAKEFVEIYTAPRFRPDQRSFLARSIEANDHIHNEDPYIHKVKPAKGAGLVKDIIINLPTIKVDLDNDNELTLKEVAQMYIRTRLVSYFREEHPMTYGIMNYVEGWRFNKKNYNANSCIIRLAAGVKIKDFTEALEGFKHYAIDEHKIADDIKAYLTNSKADWYMFMNGATVTENPEIAYDEIFRRLLGTLSESAESKIERVKEFAKVEEGKLFPAILVDKFAYVTANIEKITKYIEAYIDNWKVNIFNSEELREDAKKKESFKDNKKSFTKKFNNDKKSFEKKDNSFKKSFKKDYRK